MAITFNAKHHVKNRLTAALKVWQENNKNTELKHHLRCLKHRSTQINYNSYPDNNELYNILLLTLVNAVYVEVWNQHYMATVQMLGKLWKPVIFLRHGGLLDAYMEVQTDRHMTRH